MRLSERLMISANMIKTGSYPADIGTDHAYLPIYLIKNGICKNVIATDVRKGPLKIAEKNIEAYGLKDNISIRQGWGLTPVYEDRVDCAILSGMGGFLINNILEKGKRKALDIEYFILQPVQFVEETRKFLYSNNYRIYDESLVKEKGKIYQVMSVEHGEDNICHEIYFEIGKKLIEKKDPLLYEYIQLKIDEINSIITKIGPGDSQKAAASINEYKCRLGRLMEVLKCL